MQVFIRLYRKNYRRLEEKNIQLVEAVAQAKDANQAKIWLNEWGRFRFFRMGFDRSKGKYF